MLTEPIPKSGFDFLLKLTAKMKAIDGLLSLEQDRNLEFRSDSNGEAAIHQSQVRSSERPFIDLHYS